jgi:hypothetical protein
MQIGTAQNNYLAFEAREISSPESGPQGTLVLYWPAAPSGQNSGCSANVTWPLLDDVIVLGVGPLDPKTVTITVSLSLVPPASCATMNNNLGCILCIIHELASMAPFLTIKNVGQFLQTALMHGHRDFMPFLQVHSGKA